MDREKAKHRGKTVLGFPLTLLAVILMAVGGALWAAGELIGVVNPDPNDTTTEFVKFLNERTHGVFNVLVLGLLGWAGLHFYGVA